MSLLFLSSLDDFTSVIVLKLNKVQPLLQEIPSGRELAYLHGNKWTSSDLCRMEVVILQKLKWDIPKTNYLTFLRLFEKLFAQLHHTSLCLDNLIHMAESFTKLDDSTVFKVWL